MEDLAGAVGSVTDIIDPYNGKDAEILIGKPDVTVHKTPYLHGFMNQLSPNFSRTGYGVWVDRLRRNRL